MIEAVLSRLQEDDRQKIDVGRLRDELPPLVADHEIRLVYAAW